MIKKNKEYVEKVRKTCPSCGIKMLLHQLNKYCVFCQKGMTVPRR